MSILYFDSRLNYQKILDEGSVSITTNTFPATATVDHDLGFKPNVKLWVEASSGRFIPPLKGAGVTTAIIGEVYADLASSIDGVSYSVSNTQLKINLYSFSVITREIYYRIYLDAD